MAALEVEFFIEKYDETLDHARRTGAFNQELDSLYVIPVNIQPRELELDTFYGALWVPPLQIQQAIAPVEHWRGVTAFSSVWSEFDSTFAGHRLDLSRFRCYLWLDQVMPEVVTLACHEMPFMFESIKNQVEQDFNIIVK